MARSRKVSGLNPYVSVGGDCLSRVTGAEGIQGQFAEEVFVEGVFGVGIVPFLFHPFDKLRDQ